MNIAKWKIADIIKWCQENNELEWLKEESAKKIEVKVYPKVASVSKNGKKSWKADKTATPTIEVQPIDFFTLKSNFIRKFFPSEAKKREEAKVDWHDLIASL